MNLTTARTTLGLILAAGCVAFIIGAIGQGLVAPGRHDGDRAFYWNWVWIFTGISAAVVAVLCLASWLLFGEDDTDGSR